MAIFRFNSLMSIRRFSTALVAALISFACMTRDAAPEAAALPEAKIQKTRIEHVLPQRDAVGPTPTRLEWTAVEGVDSYLVSVENEIEIPVFDQEGIKGTSVPWPKEIRVEPGTYYWRIAGIKGDRIVADSGRAAFVVLERDK